jgi:SNF2 family DNA or RNA helicase
MKLTTGKKQGFIIEGTTSELRKAADLPGAVYRRSEGIVRLPENLASYRALRGFSFDTVHPNAQDSLDDLRDAHRAHRRNVRVATRRFKLTGETDIPVPLKSIPMEHQVRAFGFCSMLDEAALFMDMGTGKTLDAIALIIHRAMQARPKPFRALVICPRAVKPVWPREFGKHCAQPVSIGIDEVPEPGMIQVWVTNYDRIKRERGRLAKWKPDMIILDESHRIKNRKAARTKAVLALKARFRLIMTGSPMGKCISEVWSQIRFLRPDIFGTYSQFQDRYLKMGGYMKFKVVGYQNEQEFADKLHSIAFRVTKDECMDLPPLNYQRLYVEADKKAQDIYAEMDLNYFFEQDGEEVSVDREATKQMKLRQIVGGIVKSDGQELVHVSNIKASTLEELLEARANDKTVVYFSFTHEIKIAQEICQRLGIGYLTLQGSTSEKDRAVFEDKFQEDPIYKVALIQIATGAEGMTLVAANLVAFYSPTFSYTGYVQARDRINRRGQERPMTVVFIIMKDTVDEHVVDVLELNRQLTDTFMESKRKYNMATKTPKTPKTEETKAPKAAVEKTGFTASALAEQLGIAPAELRKHLRAVGAVKPAGGWTWATEKDAADVRKSVEARMNELASAPAKEKAPKKDVAPQKDAEPAAPKKPATKSPKKPTPKAE